MLAVAVVPETEEATTPTDCPALRLAAVKVGTKGRLASETNCGALAKTAELLELWLLWSFGRHKRAAGGFCLFLKLIIRGVVKQMSRKSCGSGGVGRPRKDNYRDSARCAE